MNTNIKITNITTDRKIEIDRKNGRQENWN